MRNKFLRTSHAYGKDHYWLKMGNLCDCVQQQSEEKRKDSKKISKSSLKKHPSAQQLLEETENLSPEKPKDEETATDEGGETEDHVAEKEPQQVEAEIVTHEEERKTEPKLEVPSEKTKQEEEKQQPLPTVTETSEPEAARSHKSSSSSSSSNSSDKEEEKKKEKEEEVVFHAVAEPEPSNQPKLELEYDQEKQHEPEPEQEPDSVPSPKGDPEDDPKPDPDPVPETPVQETPVQEPVPETKPEVPQSEPVPEPERDPVPEIMSDPVLESEVDPVVLESEPDPVTEPKPDPVLESEVDSVLEGGVAVLMVEPATQSEQVMEEEKDSNSSDNEDDNVLVAGGSHLMRSFVDGCQIKLYSHSSSGNLRIMENGDVNGLGGNGKRATFTVHVNGLRQVALQNVKNPDLWLQVKDDELSGNGTGNEYCYFNLSEHDGFVVFESVLSPDTHIGVRENGDVKKPSHTGTRKHAQFTPIMKNDTLAGESELLAYFKSGRCIFLTSHGSGKSLRIVDKKVNGLGGRGKKASFLVHVRRSDVIALQNVKDPSSWLRIRKNRLEGNGSGGRFCEFKVEENDGHVTLESVVTPGHYVGIDSKGVVTVATDASTECAHFTPHVKLRRAGDSELLRRFTEENVIVLHSRASGNTIRFKGGEVEGTGGHGSRAQFTVHIKAPGVVALQNKNEPKQWLRIMDDELNSKGRGGSLCDWIVQEVDGYVVLESVRYPGHHVGVRESGEVKQPSQTGQGLHGQFTPVVITSWDEKD